MKINLINIKLNNYIKIYTKLNTYNEQPNHNRSRRQSKNQTILA